MRLWLNDRLGRDLTVSIDLDRSPGWVPLLNGTGRLGHASDSFDLRFVHGTPGLGDMYEIGTFVLGVDDLDSSPATLVNSDDYENEEIHVLIAEHVRLTLSDPF